MREGRTTNAIRDFVSEVTGQRWHLGVRMHNDERAALIQATDAIRAMVDGGEPYAFKHGYFGQCKIYRVPGTVKYLVAADSNPYGFQLDLTIALQRVVEDVFASPDLRPSPKVLLVAYDLADLVFHNTILNSIIPTLQARLGPEWEVVPECNEWIRMNERGDGWPTGSKKQAAKAHAALFLLSKSWDEVARLKWQMQAFTAPDQSLRYVAALLDKMQTLPPFLASTPFNLFHLGHLDAVVEALQAL